MSANTPMPYGLQQLRAWIAAGKRPPIAETLQFYLLEADEGRAVFGGVPGAHSYNPFDVAHGGYAATLLDSACGCAVQSLLSETRAYTTIELKVSLHRALSAASGEVRAEATILSMGNRVAFAQGRLTDSEGRLCASATSSLLVFDRKPS
ncbi:MAG: PaaI family thioesterase [Steroidobacteraceae bacterium]